MAVPPSWLRYAAALSVATPSVVTAIHQHGARAKEGATRDVRWLPPKSAQVPLPMTAPPAQKVLLCTSIGRSARQLYPPMSLEEGPHRYLSQSRTRRPKRGVCPSCRSPLRGCSPPCRQCRLWCRCRRTSGCQLWRRLGAATQHANLRRGGGTHHLSRDARVADRGKRERHLPIRPRHLLDAPLPCMCGVDTGDRERREDREKRQERDEGCYARHCRLPFVVTGKREELREQCPC